MATRDITLDVTIRAKTEDASKASRALSDVEKEAAKAGASMKGMSQESALLDAQLAKSKGRLKELEQALAQVGDDKKLRQAIRSERSWIAELEKSFKDLVPALAPEVAKAGEQAGSLFVSGISDSLGGQGKTILIGALVGAAAVAAVPVGAALSGAVTSALGAVGIAGGIFAASKDPVVRSAATQFGQDISRMFFSSGDGFIEPIRRSLGLLDQDFAKLDLGHAFAPLADDTEQLANGVGRFATNIMPGLDKAFEKSGPFIHALSDGLGETGSALSQFTDDISRNHGAVEGLRELFSGVDMTVRALGKTFEFLSAANDIVVKGWALLAHAAADVAGFLGLPADKMHHLADAADRFTSDTGSGTVPAVNALGDAFAGSAGKADQLASAIVAVNDAQTKFLALNGNVDDAQLAVDKGFTELTKSLHDNGKAWDGLSVKAEANRGAFNSTRGDLERLREANIANGMSVVAADAQYNEGIKKLLEFARQAGATKDELDALAKKYEINVTEIRTTISQTIVANKNDKNFDLKFGGARASGGPVMAGYTYLVNENTPNSEYFTPSTSGYISPHGATAGGGSSVTLNVGGAPSGALEGLFVQWLMKALSAEIRGQGGQLSVLGLKAA